MSFLFGNDDQLLKVFQELGKQTEKMVKEHIERMERQTVAIEETAKHMKWMQEDIHELKEAIVCAPPGTGGPIYQESKAHFNSFQEKKRKLDEHLSRNGQSI